MSRQRSGSVIDSIKGLYNKDVKAKQKVEELNASGGLHHFLGKLRDKSKTVFFRVEPTGVKYVEKAKNDETSAEELKKELDAAKLFLYTTWVRFQMDTISDVVAWWCMEPADASAAESSSDKKGKKKASTASSTIEKEYSFHVKRTVQMKKLVYDYMEELKKKMGVVVRDRSASVMGGRPPMPVGLQKPAATSSTAAAPAESADKKKPQADEEAKPAAAAETAEPKKPKREKKQFKKDAKKSETKKAGDAAETTPVADADDAAPKKKKKKAAAPEETESETKPKEAAAPAAEEEKPKKKKKKAAEVDAE